MTRTAIKSWWKQQGNINIIQRIQNLDIRVVLQLIDSGAVDASINEIVSLIPHAKEPTQLALVARDPVEVDQFAKPSPRAIQLALKKMQPNPPEWLTDLANDHRINRSN